MKNLKDGVDEAEDEVGEPIQLISSLKRNRNSHNLTNLGFQQP